MPETPYDFIAGDFHALRTTLQPKEKEYLELLLDNLPAASVILDLGCGTGRPIAAYLVERGFQVVGVDGSAAMLEIARGAMPEQRWIHAMMEQVELEPVTFAAAVCWDSLFHLPRDMYEPVLRKIHEWLLHGGRLMVSSGGVVDETGSGFTDRMFGHEFYYDSPSPRQMAVILDQLGFDTVLAEMCSKPDGERDKGKWSTIAVKR